MNELAMNSCIEELESVFTNIRFSNYDNDGVINPSGYLDQIKDSLNKIFENKIVCTDIFYTLNTDKEYFGIIVNPAIDSVNAIKIFATDEDVVLNKYQLELDSKLFNLGLSSTELVAMIIYEISSMMSEGTISETRAMIDLHVLSEDDIIHIRDSVNYCQLITYALKDTMYKVSSMLFKEDTDELLANDTVKTMKLNDSLVSAQGKLITGVSGINDTVRNPKTIILKWVFMIYQDIKGNTASARDTLKDAREFTASIIQQGEIDKTIVSIDRIASQSLFESCSLNSVFESKALYALNELSIFKSLKMNGLRSIEDDYYELALQAKTAETEEDALYVIRGINTRLSVLEDYIYNTDLKDSEKKHWTYVANQYRSLRESILKSKINKRKYSDIFMSYGDFPSDND